jgi:hypothetical protein
MALLQMGEECSTAAGASAIITESKKKLKRKKDKGGGKTQAEAGAVWSLVVLYIR